MRDEDAKDALIYRQGDGRDALVATGAHELVQTENALRIGGDRLGKAGGRPIANQLFHPARLVADGMQQTEANRNARWRREREMKARNHARAGVYRQRQPRIAGFASTLVEDAILNLHMIEVDYLQRPFRDVAQPHLSHVPISSRRQGRAFCDPRNREAAPE